MSAKQSAVVALVCEALSVLCCAVVVGLIYGAVFGFGCIALLFALMSVIAARATLKAQSSSSSG
ncbi:hypothetical protein K6V98_00220 [Collinsella sp. AGMB00827]|uniref:Uncharacterized protein n=1 Tax=Collinsella ureilytica TaxID=2869515 RepID=A0ABS7MI85_9ACTN|nr:hypothetical protein [Collinsella urealyticum]MBY4796795.1 hypothetical protein [Collinsella urealyticum]